MLIASNSQLFAGDHDFTKFNIIPSVVLDTDIPEKSVDHGTRGKS